MDLERLFLAVSSKIWERLGACLFLPKGSDFDGSWAFMAGSERYQCQEQLVRIFGGDDDPHRKQTNKPYEGRWLCSSCWS